MNLSVYKIDGSNSGKEVTLDEKVFGVTPNDHAIYLDVVQYLANQRQGTAKTKDRSENAHSTKKIGPQKGGGGARHGSLKSGIYVGGATHGQHNRLRHPGSMGASSWPSRVFPGMRMAGHMGDSRVKVRNLQVVKVLPESNLIVVKGSVPGAKGSYVIVEA